MGQGTTCEGPALQLHRKQCCLRGNGQCIPEAGSMASSGPKGWAALETGRQSGLQCRQLVRVLAPESSKGSGPRGWAGWSLSLCAAWRDCPPRAPAPRREACTHHGAGHVTLPALWTGDHRPSRMKGDEGEGLRGLCGSAGEGCLGGCWGPGWGSLLDERGRETHWTRGSSWTGVWRCKNNQES